MVTLKDRVADYLALRSTGPEWVGRWYDRVSKGELPLPDILDDIEKGFGAEERRRVETLWRVGARRN